MADPIIDPPNDDLPAPRQRERRAVNITCDGCGCRLDSEGQIITVGAKMKAFAKLEDTIEKQKEKIAALEEKIATLTAAPPAPPADTRSRWLPD